MEFKRRLIQDCDRHGRYQFYFSVPSNLEEWQRWKNTYQKSAWFTNITRD